MLGRAGIPKCAIITSLAGVATPDLATFAGVLHGLSHGQRVPLEYFCFGERHRRRNALLQVCVLWGGGGRLGKCEVVPGQLGWD